MARDDGDLSGGDDRDGRPRCSSHLYCSLPVSHLARVTGRLHTAPGHYSHCHCSFLSPAAGRWRNRRCRCELLLLLLLAVATEEEVDSCALAAPMMHPSAAPDSDFMILHSHDPMFDWQAMVLLAARGQAHPSIRPTLPERGEVRTRTPASSTANYKFR